MDKYRRKLKRFGTGTFQKKKWYLYLALFPVFLALTFLAVPPGDECRANSAGPPSILIIVPYAPDDLQITLVPDGVQADRTDKAFESYFTFYLVDMKAGAYTLEISTGDKSFQKTVTLYPRSYDNTWVLNLDKGILTAGMPLSRSVMLVSLRVLATLLLEGLVFWGFGYRRKKSWIIFLVVNLLTQGILNVSLDLSSNPLDSYIIFQLVLGEVMVFITEIVLFLILIDEKSASMTFLYVICANMLSLFAGGFLITALPV